MNDDAFWAGWNTAEHEAWTGIRRKHHLEDTDDFRRGYEAFDAIGMEPLPERAPMGMVV